jgi:hypothetical protein
MECAELNFAKSASAGDARLGAGKRLLISGASPATDLTIRRFSLFLDDDEIGRAVLNVREF